MALGPSKIRVLREHMIKLHLYGLR